jgi:hypothetical protein
MKRLFILASAVAAASSLSGCGAIKATDKILPTDYTTVYRDKYVAPPANTAASYNVSASNRVVARIEGESVTAQPASPPPLANTAQIPAGNAFGGNTPILVQPIEINTITAPALPAASPNFASQQASLSEMDQPIVLSRLSSTDIRAIQRALMDRGYRITSVDGVMGPETGAAVRAFNRDNGLVPNALTGRSLQLLGLSALL